MVGVSIRLFLVMAVSILVDFSRFRILYRAARFMATKPLKLTRYTLALNIKLLCVIAGLALVWLLDSWG